MIDYKSFFKTFITMGVLGYDDLVCQLNKMCAEGNISELDKEELLALASEKGQNSN